MSSSYTYYKREFPIGEGHTDYEKYLRTVELLSLQKPIAEMASPEELLFQVTHQSAELWMKLMLHEIHRAVEFMKCGKLQMASRCFRLINDIQHTLLFQVDLIASHISIVEYEKIRLALGQGSGMESPGFNWLLEAPPGIWEAFSGVLKERNITLKEIYRNYETHIELHTLAENLMDFDDLFHKWRNHHVDLVARTIGSEAQSLKGISSKVLEKGAKVRFFPELLAVRAEITNESAVAYGGQPLS